MPPVDTAWYEAFFEKVLVMRRNHWDAKKRHMKQAAVSEYRLGLEIDKLIRDEIKRRKDATEATTQQNKMDIQNGKVYQGKFF